MKIKSMAAIAFLFSTFCLMAQTNATITAQTPLPETKVDFWKYSIAIVLPIILNGFKKLVPNIPKWMIPVSTPFLGLLLGGIMKWTGLHEIGWWDAAEAGGLAVLIREGWNQIVVKGLGSGSDGGVLKSIIIGFATMLALPSMAAQPSVHGTNKALQAYVDGADKKTAKSTAAAIAKEYNDQFQAGEFQIEVAGHARTMDMENFDKSLVFGGNYYVTSGAGFHAAAQFRDANDRFVDGVEFGLVARVPVQVIRSAIVFGVGAEWQRVSVYSSTFDEESESSTRHENREDRFAVYAEAGVLVRLNRRLDVFAKVRGNRSTDGPEGEHITLIGGTAITF